MSSLQIVIVEKSGNLRPLLVKQFDEASIYKKCGFKQNDHFAKQHEWQSKQYTIELYGKCIGRSNNINHYVFQQQQQQQMFGNCALILRENNIPIHLNVQKWKELESDMKSISRKEDVLACDENNDENDNDDVKEHIEKKEFKEEEKEEDKSTFLIENVTTTTVESNCFDGLISELEEEPYLIEK